MGSAVARFGATIRSPSTWFTGFSKPSSPGGWEPHPFYAGSDIFNAAAPGLVFNVNVNETLIGTASSPLLDIRCVVDGRAVVGAIYNKDGSTSCDLTFLSHGGMHSVAAYAVHDGARGASLIGSPLFFRTVANALAVNESATSRLAASEAALRASTPNNTALLVGVYVSS